MPNTINIQSILEGLGAIAPVMIPLIITGTAAYIHGAAKENIKNEYGLDYTDVNFFDPYAKTESQRRLEEQAREKSGSKAGEGTSEPKEDKDSAKERVENPSKGESKVWKDLDNVKGKDRKTSGKGKNKKYYEWDNTHNDIEVYDKNGNHLGSMDPTTGEMYKPAVPGRTIKK